VQKIQRETNCLDCDEYFQLALLLINNNSTSCRIIKCLEEGSSVGHWETLLWQKLALLAPEKLVKIDHGTDYTSYFESFSLIEVALPNLEKLKNLQVLDMSGTNFEDKHLVQLARISPSLKSLTIQSDGEITDIGLAALSGMEKLEEFLYGFNGDICDCEKMCQWQDEFATR